MATILSDVVFQDELRDYMAEPIIEKTAFFDSGILVRNNEMSALLASPSNEFRIPMWLDLDYSLEPNYSNDVFEDIATPLSVSTTSMRGRAAYLNEGWATMQLVKNITNQDPLDYVRSRLTGYWQRQYQRRIVATALGIYNNNVAENNSDMVVATGGDIDAAAVITARGTMGDHQLDDSGSMGAIVMHSAVYTRLSIQNQIVDIPASDQSPRFTTFQGMRVVLDDGLPVTQNAEGVNEYTSIIFGGGVFGFAESQPAGLDGLAVVRVEERGNGGGVETLWNRKDLLLHPMGYSFTSDTVTGNGTESRPASASWQDLALAANWERVLPRYSVPMAFVRSTAA